jgi:ArsR family transcriptional regulator, arsenate/arsenite/antimonite-responsive transcriptional repressor
MRRELGVVEAPAACCSPLVGARMSHDDADTTAAVFKALADPARVRIVNLLATTGQACVCDLTPPLGLSQPTVSHHLKKLTDVGLLRREQRGIWAFYSIEPGVLDRLKTVFETGGAR